MSRYWTSLKKTAKPQLKYLTQLEDWWTDKNLGKKRTNKEQIFDNFCTDIFILYVNSYKTLTI